MTSIQVDSRTFDFPDGWLVTKYDDTTFYNNQFKGKARKSRGLKKEMKALDLIVLNPTDGVLYLIESKDYRTYRRQKEESPADEYIHKVIDTLTGILPTALCGKRNSYGKHIDAGEDTIASAIASRQSTTDGSAFRAASKVIETISSCVRSFRYPEQNPL